MPLVAIPQYRVFYTSCFLVKYLGLFYVIIYDGDLCGKHQEIAFHLMISTCLFIDNLCELLVSYPEA